MNANVAIKLAAAFVREGVDCKDKLCSSCPLYIYANTSSLTTSSLTTCSVSVVTSALCERDIKSPSLYADITVHFISRSLSEAIQRLMFGGSESDSFIQR